MATKTSVGSGLWSVPGTWDAGVPVDNDVVVIAAGHVVEFDVDQSGFANGIDGLTITGTLSLTRTAGTYYLKIKAAKTIAVAGTFDCGTSVSPIPFAAKHTVTGGAAWYINGAAGGTMTVYAAEPVIKTVRLSGAEAVGQTELSVDTDITGDIWADGDTIKVDDINGRDTEERVIAAGGRASGAITVTAGLSTAKITGALVHLITRNVKFVSTTAIIQNFAAGKLTIAGGQFTQATAYQCVLLSCTSASVTGGAFSCTTLANAIYGCDYITISGGVFSGGASAIASSASITVSGGTFSGFTNGLFMVRFGLISGGLFSGDTNAINQSTSVTVVGGTFNGNTQHINISSVLVRNTTFTNSTYDLYSSYATLFNTSLGGATENYLYQNLLQEYYSESIDHDGSAGAYKAWTKGGVTTSQASVLPTGYTKAYLTVLESATVEGYWQREVTVSAGASVNIETQLRKDASMTYLPRAIVFNKASTDPFAGGAGLHTFTMTDSVDTWEDDLYTYTNSGTEDVTLVVRIQGMNATGNLYSALDVEQINVDLTGAIAKIDVIDALVDAIKAKTDQLAFSVANQVDANSLTGGLTEGQIRTAIGLAAANLDTQLADIPTVVENRQEMDSNSTRLASIDGKTTNLPADPADQSAVEAAITAIPAGISVNDILGMQVEGTYTLQQILRIMSSALAGKLSGGGTATLKFRDLQDTLDRITATVDQATGDRDNITLDLS